MSGAENRKSVFISIGNRYLDQYTEFLDGLEDLLEKNGVRPRVMNKTDYPTKSPLAKISEVLKECDGAIIVAFERIYIETGMEKRGSRPGGGAPLKDTACTTPWISRPAWARPCGTTRRIPSSIRLRNRPAGSPRALAREGERASSGASASSVRTRPRA